MKRKAPGKGPTAPPLPSDFLQLRQLRQLQEVQLGDAAPRSRPAPPALVPVPSQAVAPANPFGFKAPVHGAICLLEPAPPHATVSATRELGPAPPLSPSSGLQTPPPVPSPAPLPDSPVPAGPLTQAPPSSAVAPPTVPAPAPPRPLASLPAVHTMHPKDKVREWLLHSSGKAPAGVSGQPHVPGSSTGNHNLTSSRLANGDSLGFPHRFTEPVLPIPAAANPAAPLRPKRPREPRRSRHARPDPHRLRAALPFPPLPPGWQHHITRVPRQGRHHYYFSDVVGDVHWTHPITRRRYQLLGSGDAVDLYEPDAQSGRPTTNPVVIDLAGEEDPLDTEPWRKVRRTAGHSSPPPPPPPPPPAPPPPPFDDWEPPLAPEPGPPAGQPAAPPAPQPPNQPAADAGVDDLQPPNGMLYSLSCTAPLPIVPPPVAPTPPDSDPLRPSDPTGWLADLKLRRLAEAVVRQREAIQRRLAAPGEPAVPPHDADAEGLLAHLQAAALSRVAERPPGTAAPGTAGVFATGTHRPPEGSAAPGAWPALGPPAPNPAPPSVVAVPAIPRPAPSFVSAYCDRPPASSTPVQAPPQVPLPPTTNPRPAGVPARPPPAVVAPGPPSHFLPPPVVAVGPQFPSSAGVQKPALPTPPQPRLPVPAVVSRGPPPTPWPPVSPAPRPPPPRSPGQWPAVAAAPASAPGTQHHADPFRRFLQSTAGSHLQLPPPSTLPSGRPPPPPTTDRAFLLARALEARRHIAAQQQPPPPYRPLR